MPSNSNKLMNNISSQLKLSALQNLSLRKFYHLRLISFEGFIWITALIYLAVFVNPYESHFTICPLNNLGFEHCPGCGLGNSIALIFRGSIIESFSAHVFGIPALLIILHRIYSIIRFNLSKEKTNIK